MTVHGFKPFPPTQVYPMKEKQLESHLNKKWVLVSRKDFTEEEMAKINSEIKDGVFVYGN